MAKAPIDATLISMNSLNTSPFMAHSHASFITPSPTGRKATMYQAMRGAPPANQPTLACAMTMPAMSMASDMPGLRKLLSSISFAV